MNLMNTMINWLNDEPLRGPAMQHDGVFGLLSWNDIRTNANRPLIDFSTIGWLTVLVVGLPVVMWN